MNKLFVIRWMLPNGYVLSVSYYWNESEAEGKIKRHPEWKFNVVENNTINKIWEAV